MYLKQIRKMKRNIRIAVKFFLNLSLLKNEDKMKIKNSVAVDAITVRDRQKKIDAK